MQIARQLCVDDSPIAFQVKERGLHSYTVNPKAARSLVKCRIYKQCLLQLQICV